MDADQLRGIFTGFFAERSHHIVPSASLVPHHSRAPMFTNAGMNQFIAYYLGEELPPYRRATSVQKCVRIRGKHDDIDLVGRTTRHLTFFEMLGNFSFGDYFKADAIPWAWELLTEELGLDGDRLWATVHTSDDEAAEIWCDAVGLAPERVQRMGADNFWEMGETGPCGPCSEIYLDRGPQLGPAGGPAGGGGEERYVELWNLVFTQYDRQPGGALEPLPRPNIDTGAGLERMLTVLEDVPSIWECGVIRPIIARAEALTGRTYGEDPAADVALRVLADHSRSTSLLIGDGVLPSNDGRGYVLRRLIRRTVLTARRFGVDKPVTRELASAIAEVLGSAYPELIDDIDLVQGVLEREEASFDRTLRTGLNLLAEALESTGGAPEGAGRQVLSGDVAFRLHDTHGFPIELTEELATEAGVVVDRSGYEERMDQQRSRARQAARSSAAADEDSYRRILEREGPTVFVGRSLDSYAVPTRVLAVLASREPGIAEIFLERTPFYREGGGQVGDTGSIVTETGRAEVIDTIPALPDLTAHRARVSGEIFADQDALATIDVPRREAVRRNHTGTHLLHAALRSVLGDQVRQQGSLVAPDRLRFDFSHSGAPAPEELSAVLAMANADVLSDDPVETVETSKDKAQAMGAVAFFDEKYNDTVRVVRAGPHSLEFCAGTHVDALGMIGPIAIVSEGSIGSGTRRIEAVTGHASIERSLRHEALVNDAASLLKVEPDGVLDALQRLLDRQRAAEKDLLRLRRATLESEAADLAAGAFALTGASAPRGSGATERSGALPSDRAARGVVVARRDGLASDELRSLAQAVVRRDGIRAVALVGSPDGAKVAIAVAVSKSAQGSDAASSLRWDAGAVAKEMAGAVGGGGGGSPELAVAGGRQVERIGDALAAARRSLGGG